jgi:hypothetical protein
MVLNCNFDDAVALFPEQSFVVCNCEFPYCNVTPFPFTDYKSSLLTAATKGLLASDVVLSKSYSDICVKFTASQRTTVISRNQSTGRAITAILNSHPEVTVAKFSCPGDPLSSFGLNFFGFAYVTHVALEKCLIPSGRLGFGPNIRTLGLLFALPGLEAVLDLTDCKLLEHITIAGTRIGVYSDKNPVGVKLPQRKPLTVELCGHWRIDQFHYTMEQFKGIADVSLISNNVDFDNPECK